MKASIRKIPTPGEATEFDLVRCTPPALFSDTFRSIALHYPLAHSAGERIRKAAELDPTATNQRYTSKFPLDV